MENGIKGAIKFIGIGMVILPTAFGSVAKAQNKTQIMIANCDTSHHPVRVTAYNHNSNEPSSQAKIHSSEQKPVFCTTSKCDLFLISGPKDKHDITSVPMLYVRVHDDHEISPSNDPSICN